MRPSKWLLFGVFLIFIISATEISPQTEKQSSKDLGRWIMGIVVKKAQENEILKRERIVYDKKVAKYNLSETPSEIIETSVYEIYGHLGKSMEKLKEKNGKKINNAKPEASELNLDTILLERYEFNLEREEMIGERGYYIISFKPKEPIGRLPFETRRDEAINRTRGNLYIDMEKFYVRRLEGQLLETFTKALSIFEMKDFTIDIRQEEFEGIIVPSSLVLIYKYRVFWGDTHEKLEYNYLNRRIIKE